MFFGKSKASLRLTRVQPGLSLDTDYYVVENVSNPSKIKIGTGISKLALINANGDEYLIEGNASKIKELFSPKYLFESTEGKLYKVVRPIGNLQRNALLKEVTTEQHDEKWQLGHGTAEYHYIQQNNKIIKLYGNSQQIKNIMEEVLPQIRQEVPKVILEGTTKEQKVQIIEKTIIREQAPVVGQPGPKGDIGERGARGEPGPQGPRGFPGPIGAQGEKGEKGDQGDVGPQGEQGIPGPRGIKGPKGDKGERGDIGPIGPQGIQGLPGPQGLIGPEGKQGPEGKIGVRGPQGEKGEKGDRGSPGQRGPEGLQGEKGDPGVIGAEYPLVLEKGVLSFKTDKLSEIVKKATAADIQDAINKIATTAISTGGGAVGIVFNGTRLLNSVSDIQFTGNGVNVQRKGKNVLVTITGGGGGGGDLSNLYPGEGIDIIDGITLNSRVVVNKISVKSNSIGVIQLSNIDNTDLVAENSFKLDVADTNNLFLPKGLVLGSGLGTSYVEFADGTTLSSRPNIFTEGFTAPASPFVGDRWFNTNNGKLFTAITDDSGVIWVELNTGLIGATGATGPQGNTGPSGIVGDYVLSFGGLTGIVGLSAGTNITISQTGNTLTISSTASGGSGGIVGDYVISVDGATGAVNLKPFIIAMAVAL